MTYAATATSNVEETRGMREVELTEAGKAWILKHYPQGIVWEYDPDKPFKLHSWASKFIELTCLGIPSRMLMEIEGQPTIRKATQ